MRVIIVPDKGPKRKLLEAAQILVAENGFESISVRDVAAAVKANIAAVNYHFGSRQNLIHLIVSGILQPLLDHRINSLEQIEKDHRRKKILPAELIASYISAIGIVQAQTGLEPKLYYQLAGRILNLPALQMPAELASVRETIRSRYLKALARVLPDIADQTLNLRFALIEEGLAQNLSHREALAEPLILLDNAITSAQLLFGASSPETEPDEDDQPLLFQF